jgi:hypothetical protein
VNIIGKPRGVWPTFVSFPGAHTFQGDGPSLAYCHASAAWDEPNPEERERAMGFQTSTTSHSKVTRLECFTGERHGPKLLYMVVGNLCILSNVHNTSTDSIIL